MTGGRSLGHSPLPALHTHRWARGGCSWEQDNLAGFAGSAQGLADVLGSAYRIIVPVPYLALEITWRFYFLKIGHSGHYGRVFKVHVSKENLTPEVLWIRSYERTFYKAATMKILGIGVDG